MDGSWDLVFLTTVCFTFASSFVYFSSSGSSPSKFGSRLSKGFFDLLSCVETFVEAKG
jgi:hypothetical protein